ncbi:DUF3800 domain-containing protein [Secundilactobacillus similis]|uniref:DUF3800 domain-containing protein n=1 Tax=Secundilactobacillus similis TaxID=414682 RepID=UPI0006D06482|nr:DUF3800 domain-containing protein [Secundilactobacillus similis]
MSFRQELESAQDRAALKASLQSDVYHLIASSNVKLFGAQINKVDLFGRQIVESKDDVYQLGFETILTELATFINTTRHSSKIITMIDSMGKTHDRKIYNSYQDALNSKAENLKVFNRTNFSPTINFADSEFTFGLQLVDFTVGALWRAVEHQDKEWSTLIKKNFPQNNSGEIFDYSYCFCGS